MSKKFENMHTRQCKKELQKLKSKPNDTYQSKNVLAITKTSNQHMLKIKSMTDLLA